MVEICENCGWSIEQHINGTVCPFDQVPGLRSGVRAADGTPEVPERVRVPERPEGSMPGHQDAKAQGGVDIRRPFTPVLVLRCKACNKVVELAVDPRESLYGQLYVAGCRHEAELTTTKSAGRRHFTLFD